MSLISQSRVRDLFHPAVAAWFSARFGPPTTAQARAWPAILAGRDTLVAAPTGSGKTLAAFLAAIDHLVRQACSSGLPDETQVVYVSPLKALSNDIQRNLEAPLAGIAGELAARGFDGVDIRAWVRTGDTPQAERSRMRQRPPHIVVTTPESLYILLGSDSGRRMLATTKTVIIDEIHALAGNKRGAHLALSLERLGALAGRRPLRIGLSATQKPIETVARFLVGTHAECAIVDAGEPRPRDLAIEVPSSPLESVMSAEVWDQVYDRLAELAGGHRTTLVFVNTRRTAERASRHLSLRLGADQVMAHHGSMARDRRLAAEQRLKAGQLRLLVATASLELGIDIGEVDLVCQIGSPRSISAFLQRVGRSGHSVGGLSKGRLFPLSRDDLVECQALLAAVTRGELDALHPPAAPLDVLAQQIAAEVAAAEWREADLLALVRHASSYRDLSDRDFADVVAMLAEGFAGRRGRRGALLLRDGLNGILRGRRGARLTALTSGGTIPDNADFTVLLEPDNQTVGTVNEDFAVESLAGDIFQLGNRSYRIRRIERGVVRVEDAQGMAPSIPFWLGEAPGRSDELSAAVSALRSAVAVRLTGGDDVDALAAWLCGKLGAVPAAARQLADYLTAAHGALGCLPTQETIVFERFFDEAGGMQMVVHSAFGSRVNRAWGLALRKRFCRKFNFELQAAATEDAIVLSLTEAHSFPLAEAARYLSGETVRSVLIQALLDAPMFQARFRWTAGIALALPRMRAGRRLPPQIARMEAEDMIGAIFPDQLACAENLVGEREVPDHPLIRQTMDDCLHEAMDIDRLEDLLRRLEDGRIRLVACDLTEPSPLAMEVLAAKPYAYLDDAPIEERRTQAVMGRRWLDPANAADIGRLDTDAILQVQEEARPDPVDAWELHDTLLWLGFLADAECRDDWREWLDMLAKAGRACRLQWPGADLWVAAERLSWFRSLWPDLTALPAIIVPPSGEGQEKTDPLREIVRGRLEGAGPVSATSLAAPLGLGRQALGGALAALEAEGFVLRGHFTPGVEEEEWCARRLLGRIHRATVRRLRSEIEPVAVRDFLRFLLEWQHVGGERRLEGEGAVTGLIRQLQGFEVAATAWESEILPVRLADYRPAWLDGECRSGRAVWARLRPRREEAVEHAGPVRTTPITLMPRRDAVCWQALIAEPGPVVPTGKAGRVFDFIRANGASFFDEILSGAKLLRPEGEEALAELVSLGLVTSDSFAGLRALLAPVRRHRRRRAASDGIDDAGRWTLVRRSGPGDGDGDEAALEHVARALLARYGLVFWKLLAREAAWLPPWRELLRVYRRLEARGEIRGGRFVAGFSGEQFALAEAVGLLRSVRKTAPSGEMVSLSAVDPLNVLGTLLPGPKLAAVAGNRFLLRDGMPLAVLAAGVPQFLQELPPAEAWEVKKTLLRGPA